MIENLGRGGSLTCASKTLAEEAGIELNLDDLHAALGLPWLFCAARSEPNMAFWSMYARDSFLGEAARLFGIHVRDLHPPETARNLDTAAEFDQHFDASYRPLIQRALEHGQPVLAWRGWSGSVGPEWGIIRQVTHTGAGFAGTVFRSVDGIDRSEDAILESPAVQVYVIETLERTAPTSDSLVHLAMRHVLIAAASGLDERFGLATGYAAFRYASQQLWLHEKEGIEAVARAQSQHIEWCRSLAQSLASGERFMAHHHRLLQPGTYDDIPRACELLRTTTADMRNWITAGGQALDARTWYDSSEGSDRLKLEFYPKFFDAVNALRFELRLGP